MGLLAGTPLDRQLQLEKKARQMGSRKYLDEYNEDVKSGQFAIRPEVRAIRDEWLPRLTEAVQITVESRDYVGEQLAGPILSSMPPGRIAASALGEVLSALMHEPGGVTRTRLLFAVARAVCGEVCIDWMKDTPRPDGIESIFFDLCKRYKRFKAKNVVAFARKRGMDEALFDKKVQAALGSILFQLLTETCTFRDEENNLRIGIQCFKEAMANGHKQWVVRLNYAVQAHLWEKAQKNAWMSPQWMPSVSPPKRFTKEDYFGGYQSLRYKLVTNTTRAHWDKIEEAFKSGQCDPLFDCINAGMETGHVVFKDILEMQEKVWHDGGGRLGLPTRDLIEQLPRLPDEIAQDPEKLKDWKINKSRIHAENIKRKSMVASFRETIMVANMFKDEEAFYFPPYLDFRGRSGPKAQYLSYLHDDVREGMLLLADTKEPGDEGRYWLMVHAAGLYGMDKLTYDERAQWTRDHMHEIARAVALGLEDDWWQNADKGKSPWQFLAACYALVKPEIAARLPVACDGTCNGLQHLAALTRDENTGRLVNLIPADRPQDQYADVTPKLVESILADANLSDVPPKEGQLSMAEIRRRALGHLKNHARDMVKQPVMTLAYNVTRDGMASQIGGKLKKAGEDPKYAKAIGRYIAFHLLPILGQAMQKPIECMAWMEEVAFEICARTTKTGKRRPGKTCLSWTTPLGFPVIQEKRRIPKSQISTALGNIAVEYDDPNANVDLTDQYRGFAPNYVHSMDATHKWLTTRRMAREGHRMWDKHDSYRTHAASRTRLGQILREEFAAMYAPDVIHNLKRDLERRFEKRLPEPPAYGNLNIADVLDSPYFFK